MKNFKVNLVPASMNMMHQLYYNYMICIIKEIADDVVIQFIEDEVNRPNVDGQHAGMFSQMQRELNLDWD